MQKKMLYFEVVLFKSVMLDTSKVRDFVSYVLEIPSRQPLEMQKTVMQMHHVME